MAVFDVEVYAIPFGQHGVIPTGRKATYFYRAGELLLQFAERSRLEADEFVDAGANDELFVMHFSGQDDAESGHGVSRSRAG